MHFSVRLGASHRGGKCTPPSWCRPYLSPAKATLLPPPHHPFLWLFFMQLPLPFLQRRFWKMLSKKRGVTSENSTAFPFSLSQKQEPPYFRLHSDPLSLDNKVAGTEPINSHVLLPASQRQNISWTLRRPEPQTFPFFGRSLSVISGALVFSEKSPLPPLHLLPLSFFYRAVLLTGGRGRRAWREEEEEDGSLVANRKRKERGEEEGNWKLLSTPSSFSFLLSFPSPLFLFSTKGFPSSPLPVSSHSPWPV